MGVPQKRQRVFFIAVRKDLAFNIKNIDKFTGVPKLNLYFNEPPIAFGEIYQKGVLSTKHEQDSRLHNYWKERLITDKSIGNIVKRLENRNSMFSVMLINNKDVAPTFTRQDRTILYDEFRSINKEEACMVQSFPLDYDFTTKQYGYLIGMSVPPIMIAQVSSEIYNQWNEIFKK
jgi:DNA (cytosine-5)-methyltransferase 1